MTKSAPINHDPAANDYAGNDTATVSTESHGLRPDSQRLVPESQPPISAGNSSDIEDDNEEDDDIEEDNEASGTWFTRRQVLAASFAGLVLGVGVGTSVTKKLLQDRERQRNRPTDVDLGFVNDMLDHHDQAVEMSLITLNKQDISVPVRQFATEIVIFQRYEIGLLEARLTVWGRERAADDRTAMAWMGMGSKVSDMMGMAQPDDLERLKNATGADADREFLTLMRSHHEGGVPMAEYAATQASDFEVLILATRMAKVQRLEVTEYTRFLDALPES
jgi:uncharacterized protein (DUF305 family)